MRRTRARWAPTGSSVEYRAARIAAALFWIDGAGFGLPAILVAHRVREKGQLPEFFGLFPMYGGPWFERMGRDEFAWLLRCFSVVCATEAVAGWLLWQRRRSGAVLGFTTLPLAAPFWYGFALPLPPGNALVRSVLVARAWHSLRG